MAPIIKQCRCGRSYLSRSWVQLDLVGYVPNGRDGAGEVLELRNCACGSTIAIDFGDTPPSTPRGEDRFPTVPAPPPSACERGGQRRAR